MTTKQQVLILPVGILGAIGSAIPLVEEVSDRLSDCAIYVFLMSLNSGNIHSKL